MEKDNLVEANCICILSEASSAEHETILADDTVMVSAAAAKESYKSVHLKIYRRRLDHTIYENRDPFSLDGS